MTNEQANQLIGSALDHGFISESQAESLTEEMSMFPGGNVLSILVRRGIITPEQGKVLEEGKSPSKTGSDHEMDLDFDEKESDITFEILSGPAATQNITSKTGPLPSQPASGSFDSRTISPSRQNPVADPQPRRSVSDALGIARNALQSAPEPAHAGSVLNPDPHMVQLLAAARERSCSDLHITPGKSPYLRCEGQLLFMDGSPMSSARTEQLCLSLLNEDQRNEFNEKQQVDFSFSAPGAGRFRANVYRQRCGVEGAFRVIPVEVPTLSSLKLPTVLERLTTYPQGLNLVTGPGGCGKTSTVAAMLEHINRHRHEHIITVEDPVEYVFEPHNCQITQREVGTHTQSFAHALRRALRQDPDVIMIGELRDLETTSISITAAETGHLVFGTLHTSSAVRTVARILDVYPPSQRAQICLMIAESLRGILSQQLIPRADGNGRVCAMEILLVTTGVSQVIKEGKTHQLVSHMQSGRKQGMISMDDALMELLQGGLISETEAYNRAENKTMFMLKTQ